MHRVLSRLFPIFGWTQNSNSERMEKKRQIIQGHLSIRLTSHRRCHRRQRRAVVTREIAMRPKTNKQQQQQRKRKKRNEKKSKREKRMYAAARISCHLAAELFTFISEQNSPSKYIYLYLYGLAVLVCQCALARHADRARSSMNMKRNGSWKKWTKQEKRLEIQIKPCRCAVCNQYSCVYLWAHTHTLNID